MFGGERLGQRHAVVDAVADAGRRGSGEGGGTIHAEVVGDLIVDCRQRPDHRGHHAVELDQRKLPSVPTGTICGSSPVCAAKPAATTCSLPAAGGRRHPRG